MFRFPRFAFSGNLCGKNPNSPFQIIPVILLTNRVAVFSSNAGNQVCIGLAKPNHSSPTIPCHQTHPR